MNARRQLILSVAIVLIALASVAVYALTSGEKKPQANTAHNHAAMSGGADTLQPVSISAGNAQRIGISYATAEMGSLTRGITTVGTVSFDETRVFNVNPKIEGWVEHLYVDFTGAPVSKGQPLMTVYSPMLVSAQEELILARTLLDGAQGEQAQSNARDLLSAARRRLSYWDISDAQIAQIEKSRTPQKTLTLRAPASGVVLEKNVTEGARIMPGMDLYKIADLSSIWIEGEVFEKDLSLIRVGTPARVTFEAYPGKEFDARVKYVYPTVSEQTRTGRIRIELHNAGLQLKPGMYANVAFTVPVHNVGLHVPRSAVLATGTRSIVFVRHADGSLVPHEVTTGLAGGDHIEILSGLKAGDVVVASANFLVDAESNLGAAMQGMTTGEAESARMREGAAQPAAPAAHQHQH